MIETLIMVDEKWSIRVKQIIKKFRNSLMVTFYIIIVSINIIIYISFLYKVIIMFVFLENFWFMWNLQLEERETEI